MAKKTPPYSNFKPFNKSQPGEHPTHYKANSDGINKELGPPVTLPKAPSTPPTNKIGDLSSPPVQQIRPVGDLDFTDYTHWNLAKFSFKVNIGGFDGEVAFQAMDGLGSSIGKMEFRDGNSSKFYKQSRPTLTSFDPVTLKKGMFTGDTKLFDWYSNVSSGSLFSDMRDVTITLCDISGNSLVDVFSWTLEKAYVTKYTPSSLDGEAEGEVAIEEIELTYQSFSTGAGAGLLGSLVGAVVGGISGALSF